MKQSAAIKFSITLFSLLLITTDIVYAQNKLPDSWQPGMTLSFILGPGMRPESSELIISDTGCYKIEKNLRSQIKRVYKVTAADLNEILAVLKKYNFETIRAERKGFAYDKPSNAYMLKWNGVTTGVRTSADMDVAEADRSKLMNIRKEIYEIIHNISMRK